MKPRSKPSRWSPQATGLVLVMLALVAGPAAAQVPQDMTFSGRLVDGAGAPLPTQFGFVTLDLFVQECPTQQSCNGLFGERHNTVWLDAQGNFAVLLGSGDQIIQGSFDAALFAGPDRYVEVIVVDNPTPGLHYLSPRVPLSSVPYTLVAQQANEIVPDPSAPRFEDCGDGTVVDRQTGLQWEKKTGTYGAGANFCDTVACPDPHDVSNRYQWSLDVTPNPDGAAFTDFLARLNGEFDPEAATGCFAGHCDWRLPKVSELQTILVGPEAAPGQPQTCSVVPCIDSDLAAIVGPASDGPHWSATTDPDLGQLTAWYANMTNGTVLSRTKLNNGPVRAVRAGSCH